MLPIFAGIVSMLADKGLDLISGAISGGADKAVEFIEEKTGIKIDTDKGLTNEQVSELKKFEMTHKIELEKLALLNKQEDNRHEERKVEVVLGDKQSARTSEHLKDLQTEIGRRVFIQTSILIPLLIVLNIFLLAYAGELKIVTELLMGVSTLIGMALSNAYRERQSMLEFLYGSSVGKDK
jgi:hypothetical protein